MTKIYAYLGDRDLDKLEFYYAHSYLEVENLDKIKIPEVEENLICFYLFYLDLFKTFEKPYTTRDQVANNEYAKEDKKFLELALKNFKF